MIIFNTMPRDQTVTFPVGEARYRIRYRPGARPGEIAKLVAPAGHYLKILRGGWVEVRPIGPTWWAWLRGFI